MCRFPANLVKSDDVVDTEPEGEVGLMQAMMHSQDNDIEAIALVTTQKDSQYEESTQMVLLKLKMVK